MPQSCRQSICLSTYFAKYFNNISGSEPIDESRFCKLPLCAYSYTTDTHPSGEFQKVPQILINQSVVQWCSHRPIHSFNIYRDSLLVMGTSLMQKILSDGAWSIFLTVPLVDLNTAKVIICSNRRFSLLNECDLSQYESNVEKADDWESNYFSEVFYKYLLSGSNCGIGSRLAKLLLFPDLFFFP